MKIIFTFLLFIFVIWFVGFFIATICVTENTFEEYVVTAYCGCEECCGKFSDGITASGYRIRHGGKFAAGPKSLSFTTVVNIPGYGIVPILDRGGAIKEGFLDVYFKDHKDAKQWGVQPLIIEILQ